MTEFQRLRANEIAENIERLKYLMNLRDNKRCFITKILRPPIIMKLCTICRMPGFSSESNTITLDYETTQAVFDTIEKQIAKFQQELETL